MSQDIDSLTFAEEIARPTGPGLARAALLFARDIAYPELRPSYYLARIAGWAEAAAARCPRWDSAQVRANRLAQLLFDEFGLRGNQEDYHHPRNSYLNEVMDRRLGLPITLAAIFLEVAARIDLPAEGVGLPGHFIVAVRGESRRTFIDPFHGGVQLNMDDLHELVHDVTGYAGSIRPEWLAPVSADAILARMLFNLQSVYVEKEEWSHALAVVEHLRVLHPRASGHVRDLGLLYYRLGSFRSAATCLEEYLARSPDAADASQVRPMLNDLLARLSRLN
jgi:regulator of sirC expression with transglutaminase-like and TPR domain